MRIKLKLADSNYKSDALSLFLCESPEEYLLENCLVFRLRILDDFDLYQAHKMNLIRQILVTTSKEDLANMCSLLIDV
jgi:hypothetical protein